VNDRRTKEYGTEHVNNILDYTWKHGVLLISCGRSTLRLIPPLIIDEDLADEALEVVKDAIARENSS